MSLIYFIRQYLEGNDCSTDHSQESYSQSDCVCHCVNRRQSATSGSPKQTKCRVSVRRHNMHVHHHIHRRHQNNQAVRDLRPVARVVAMVVAARVPVYRSSHEVLNTKFIDRKKSLLILVVPEGCYRCGEPRGYPRVGHAREGEGGTLCLNWKSACSRVPVTPEPQRASIFVTGVDQLPVTPPGIPFKPISLITSEVLTRRREMWRPPAILHPAQCVAAAAAAVACLQLPRSLRFFALCT